jgi:hypothetical protein
VKQPLSAHQAAAGSSRFPAAGVQIEVTDAGEPDTFDSIDAFGAALEKVIVE